MTEGGAGEPLDDTTCRNSGSIRDVVVVVDDSGESGVGEPIS